ncbi:MAG: acyltransferase [Desulfovibrio sp.]|nr:acyltransferase [Desulfovibrio sp.]
MSNDIAIYDENGNKINNKYTGKLSVVFKGKNSKIAIYEPQILKNLSIEMSEGCNVQIKKHIRIHSSLKIIFKSKNSKVCIGENFGCGQLLITIDSEPNLSVTIGDDCMFGHPVSIRASDGHTIYDISTKKPVNFAGDISIGNHVWCGRGVEILKNVSIPDNCIVGMGSVVTSGKFAENCVLAGKPARVVRKNVNWDRRSIVSYCKGKGIDYGEARKEHERKHSKRLLWF